MSMDSRLAPAASWLLCGLLLAAPVVVPAADLPTYTPGHHATRDEVPDVYKWDLSPLFATVKAWDAARLSLQQEIGGLEAYRGKLAQPKALRDCLALYFSLHDRTSHVQQYANLELAVAQTDEAVQARAQQGLALLDELTAAAGFIRAEILALDDRALGRAYAAKDGPAAYRAYIDNLRRRRDRVLGPEAERVLQLAGDNLWAEIDLNEIVSSSEEAFAALLANIPWPMVRDAAGGEVRLSLSNLSRFRLADDRDVRAGAVDAFLATMRQYQHVLAATLTGQCKLDVLYARARGYDTALEAYLDKDGLPVAVHDNLIGAVNANLGPLHRYMELRRRVLGLDELRLHDLYIPLVTAPQQQVPFAEALAILPEALAPLGPEYMAVLREGLDPRHGWLDLYPAAGKASGAFSANVYGRHPYVKMNYQDGLDDLSTLAHEYGHALHSHLSMTSQPYHTSRYVPFLAEIASTCNEALLGDWLAARAATKQERAALLVEELEAVRTTIYRQTLFSEFERLAHGFVEQGVPVTASLLEATYRGLIERYYGAAYTLGPDDGLEWAYIPHFYYKYYVYSYATGLSCGLAIAERIKAEGQPAVDGYMQMLRGGCSEPPLDLLRKAGVDLTRPEPIEAALRRFDAGVTELAELLGVGL